MTAPTPASSPQQPPSKKLKLTGGIPLASFNQLLAPPYFTPSQEPQPSSTVESGLTSNNPGMEDTDLDLYPGGAAPTGNDGPQTPPRNDHLNATAPGELSPPRSQGNPTTATNGGAATNGHPVVGEAQDNSQNTTANGGGSNNEQGTVVRNGSDTLLGNLNNGSTWQPGEWRSKKNVEETARAWDYVVEPNWNANQFGDVLERARQMRQRSG